MSEKVFMGILAMGFLFIGFLVGTIFSAMDIEQVDWTDRFDRLEIGIQNSSSSVCFLHGGQWWVEGDSLVWQDLSETTEAAFCIRQKPKT